MIPLPSEGRGKSPCPFGIRSSIFYLRSSSTFIRALCILALLTAGICVAQNWGAGRGGRGWGRNWDNGGGPIVWTEGGGENGGIAVNEDTVRTAREVETHSTETPNWTNAPGFEHDVFTFTRVIYKFIGPSPLGWINDFPDGDLNLSLRLQQLTSMKVDPDGRVLKLTDPDLFRYPFIFMAQPGHMELRDEEVPLLRKYLLNGGVLLVDDFWGESDWDRFEQQVQRVLPGREWKELPMSHPLFHCVFDLKQTKNELQVPTIHFWRRGANGPGRWSGDSQDMHIRAWHDDKDHIMILALHNTDTGDGWEREAVDPDYFHAFSETRAYPLAVNIIFYLMTH